MIERFKFISGVILFSFLSCHLNATGVYAQQSATLPPEFTSRPSLVSTVQITTAVQHMTAFVRPFTAANESKSASALEFSSPQTRDNEFNRNNNRRFVDWAHEDVFTWLRSWNGHRAVLVTGSAIAIVGVSTLDQRTTNQLAGWGKGSLRGDILDAANTFGGPAGILIPTTVFASALAFGDTKFQDAAFTSLQSYMYTLGFVFTTKFLVGRSRPEQGKGSRDFHPFSGSSSFPSGHTASAFATVMPWVFYYPGPVTYAMVAFATATAVARIQREKHWLSDVVTSAVISTAISHYLFNRHRRAQDPDLTLNPSVSGMSMHFTVGL